MQMKAVKYTMGQTTKEQATFGGTFTVNKQIQDFSVGGFAPYEYYTSRSEAYKVYTDGGMVVPGQWFVDNSKNPKKSEASISNTKRMMSAVFALNLGWKNQVYLDVTGRNDWSSSLYIKTGWVHILTSTRQYPVHGCSMKHSICRIGLHLLKYADRGHRSVTIPIPIM